VTNDWRTKRNLRALDRLVRARHECFPEPVWRHAITRPLIPPTLTRAVESYWRHHPLRADRLARALAARSGAPEGWCWQLGGGPSHAALPGLAGSSRPTLAEASRLLGLAQPSGRQPGRARVQILRGGERATSWGRLAFEAHFGLGDFPFEPAEQVICGACPSCRRCGARSCPGKRAGVGFALSTGRRFDSDLVHHAVPSNRAISGSAE
jgi:hypothetical protein